VKDRQNKWCDNMVSESVGDGVKTKFWVNKWLGEN